MATETQESTFKPTNDAYTGMLIISLLALIAGAVFLFLDFNQYPTAHPPKIPANAPALPKAEAPPPPQAQPAPMPEEKKDEEKKEPEKT